MKYLDLSTYEGRQKFYHRKEWKILREIQLNNHPLCKECGLKNIVNPGTDVDHKIDIVDAPEKALDLSNLQTLCKSCHSIKTNIIYSQDLRIKNKMWN